MIRIVPIFDPITPLDDEPQSTTGPGPLLCAAKGRMPQGLELVSLDTLAPAGGTPPTRWQDTITFQMLLPTRLTEFVCSRQSVRLLKRGESTKGDILDENRQCGDKGKNGRNGEQMRSDG